MTFFEIGSERLSAAGAAKKAQKMSAPSLERPPGNRPLIGSLANANPSFKLTSPTREQGRTGPPGSSILRIAPRSRRSRMGVPTPRDDSYELYSQLVRRVAEFERECVVCALGLYMHFPENATIHNFSVTQFAAISNCRPGNV